MRPDKLKLFLGCLGVHSFTVTGKWATAPCPLAPFTHKKGKDTNPSFGITVGSNKSHFHCFTCERGSLADLLGIIDFHLARRPEFKGMYQMKAAREMLEHEEDDVQVLPDYAEFVPSTDQSFEPWPEWWLDQFPPWDAHQRSADYIKGRMVMDSVAKHFDLRYDEKRDFIVCPFRTADGVLAGARGRRIGNGGGLKHYDYPCNGVRNSSLVWYNEQALNLHGPLILVEGQFDVMRMWPFHKKTMAILSAMATPYKIKKLAVEDQVLLMLDNPKVDPTGGKRTSDWVKILTDMGITCGVVEYDDDTKDAGEASDDFLASVAKDI